MGVSSCSCNGESKEKPFCICPKCHIKIPFIAVFRIGHDLVVQSKCDKCNRVHELGIEEYLEQMKQTDRSSHQCALNKEHCKKTSNDYCVNCQKWICNQCITSHEESERTLNHRLLSREIHVDMTCPLHNASFSYFCKNCDKSICQKCLEQTHARHSTCSLDSLLKEVKQIDYKSNAKLADYLMETNKNFKDTLLSLINLKIEQLNKFKIDIEAAYVANEGKNKMILKLLNALKDNQELLKDIPSFQFLTNIKTNWTINGKEPIMNGDNVENNCVEFIEFLKTHYIIDTSIDLKAAPVNVENIETLVQRDPNKIKCVITIQAHNDGINSLIQLHDQRLVTASYDKTIKIWNIETYKSEATLKGHTEEVYVIIQLKDSRLVSGSRDSTIKIWNISNWQCIKTLTEHTDIIVAITQTREGYLISGSADKTIKVWDTEKYECLFTLEEHNNTVYCFLELIDGRLISGSNDTTIKIWDPLNLQCVATLREHTDFVNCLLQLYNGKLASGSSDNNIIIWDTKKLTKVAILKGSQKVFSILQLNDNELMSGTDTNMMLWDLNTMKTIKAITGHNDAIRHLINMKDERIASCSDDNTVKIWDY